MPIFNVLSYQKLLPLAAGEPDKQVSLTGLEQTFLIYLLAAIPWTESQAAHALWADKASLSTLQKEAAAALIDGTIHKLMAYQEEETMKIAIIFDQKAGGVNGGDFLAGAWRKRDLNTKLDPENLVNVNSNNVVINVAGSYYIVASAPASEVYYHNTRLLRNGVEVALGENADCVAVHVVTRSRVVWVGSLAANDILTLEHRCYQNKATYGMGYSNNYANNIYSVMELFKL